MQQATLCCHSRTPLLSQTEAFYPSFPPLTKGRLGPSPFPLLFVRQSQICDCAAMGTHKTFPLLCKEG